MNLLTTKQVASLLSVGVSTVKRLCLSGELPECRTPGGHRRIPADAVLARIRQNDTGAQAASMREGTIPLDSPKILGMLLRGDMSSLRKSLLNLMESMDLTTIFDDLLAPALWLLGRNCVDGSMEAYQCFVASSRFADLLSWMRSEVERRVAIHHLSQPISTQLIAIGACLEEELHEFPSRMVEISLMDLGYQTVHLGGCVPVDCLIRAVVENNADLVWVSYSLTENLATTVRNNHRLFEALPPHCSLIIGGAALTSQIRSQLKFSNFIESLTLLRQHIQSGNGSLRGKRRAA